jgi:hypothetical protein
LRTRITLSLVVTGLAALALAAPGLAAPAPKDSVELYYPDLHTVLPQHLNLVNAGQEEFLRFSNGIANTGAGPWALRPDPFPGDAGPTTTTIPPSRSSATGTRSTAAASSRRP